MPRGVPYSPSEKDCREVSAMIGLGLSVEQIANIKGVTRETIHHRHQQDIDRGRPMAIAKVAETAYKLATNGKCPAMTMFWLKTQAGWKEARPDLKFDADAKSLLLKAIEGKAEEVWSDEIEDDQPEAV